MKKYKPTTKSRRHMTGIEYRKVLTASKPEKSLVRGGKSTGARNSVGRMTVRHRGGGHKRLLRDVDFSNGCIDVPATVKTIEYDPHRTGFIALLSYMNGRKTYVLASQKMKVGDTVLASETAPVTPGNRLPLKSIPIGTFVYNVEIKPHGGAKLARSAGNFAEVIARDAGYVDLKMPSTEVRKVLETAWASVGEVSNPENRLVNIGKAGRSRWLGRRPKVRGTAMNPVDHPHGGGEGVQGRGLRRAKNMWGKPIGKGQKTRTPKKYSNVHIVRRRKVGKKR